jgi:hypothetical protein
MTAQKIPPRQNIYVDAVIALYLQLPDTPVKPSYNDRLTASGFFAQAIPLHTIEAALLLASLRRLSRQNDQPPLSPVRSLAYFVPVIQEISASPLPDGYSLYLRNKLTALIPF